MLLREGSEGKPVIWYERGHTMKESKCVKVEVEGYEGVSSSKSQTTREALAAARIGGRGLTCPPGTDFCDHHRPDLVDLVLLIV